MHLESACPLWNSVTSVFSPVNTTNEGFNVRLATCQKVGIIMM